MDIGSRAGGGEENLGLATGFKAWLFSQLYNIEPLYAGVGAII